MEMKGIPQARSTRFRRLLLASVLVLGAPVNPPHALQAQAAAGIRGIQADPTSVAEEVLAFRELKYGMFIHYGMSTFDGSELSDGETDVEEFNPTDQDVDQWIRVAKAAGMKYAVLTAKHVAGHCLWDSQVQWKGGEFAYDAGASPVETDVVAAYLEACAKYGIVPGIYYCTMDRRHSHQEIDWTPSLPYLTQEYFQLMQDHLTELHTLYPAIAVQWIDIPRHLTQGQRSTLYDLVRSLNPECLVMYNYGQESRDISGDYTIEVAAEVTWPTDVLNSEKNLIGEPFQVRQEYGGKTYELAYEHAISITGGWFWHPGSGPKPLGDLTGELQKTWDLNGNFLLNVPPDQRGQIPQDFVERLDEIRSELGLDTATTAIGPKPGISGRRLRALRINNFPSLWIGPLGTGGEGAGAHNLLGRHLDATVPLHGR